MKQITFDELTVEQYQELFSIHRTEADDFDKAIRSVSVLTNLSITEVEDLSMDEFNLISRVATEAFSPRLQKVPVPKVLQLSIGKYRIARTATEITTRQYIDIEYFISMGIIENLHAIVACLLVPAKHKFSFRRKAKYNKGDHARVTEAVLHCNFLQIHGICVYFLNLYNGAITGLSGKMIKDVQDNFETLDTSAKSLQVMTRDMLLPNDYPLQMK